MNIGLYFGSFNPIHIGHLIVANSILERAKLDQAWFIISPQSPFKKVHSLAPNNHRLDMVKKAVRSHPKLYASGIEFDLPKPSYTIHTLDKLAVKHPTTAFSMIMGADNLIHFEKWKEFERILDQVDIHVYDRAIEEEIPEKWANHTKIHRHALPLVSVSSTQLRKQVHKGMSIKYWVTEDVETYIKTQKLYQ